MDGQEPEAIDEQLSGETPEDVAVLYSWANLQGAKYRDFSASRREYRAQMRHRAAQAQRDAEVRAKDEAELAAAAAEKAAREAEEAARFHDSALHRAAESSEQHSVEIETAARARAMRHAEEMSRRAASERVEAARRAEAVAAAEAAARREAREMAEAHASAQRQAQRYAESEFRRRTLAGPQPSAILPGQISDPYDAPQVPLPGRIFHQPVVPDEDMLPMRYPQTRDARHIVPQFDSDMSQVVEPRGSFIDESLNQPTNAADRPISYYHEPDTMEHVAAVDQYAQYGQFAPYASAPHTPEPERNVVRPVAETPQPLPDATRALFGGNPLDDPPARPRRGYQPDEASGFHPAYQGPLNTTPVNASPAASDEVPAWLYGRAEPQQPAPRMRAPASPTVDTLQHSRERVAARWFALKGVFDHGVVEQQPELPVAREAEMRAPMLTIFSLAGGVGKTSLVATLGRALSSTGEKVLLTDTTSHGLLPFYFGASELRPGVVRTFSPPAGSADAPIYLVSYDVMQKDATSGDVLAEELSRNSRGMQRVILDLSPSASWVARRLVRMNSVVVVPVAPDMNSVISLGAVEKFFADMLDGNNRSVQPHYLLNQFDASLPLHLDVREVMRQQLGDRLLPFVIRRSPSVSEALAEGMTVVDYAPESPVAGDYLNLAAWLRAQSAPAATGNKNARWSER